MYKIKKIYSKRLLDYIPSTGIAMQLCTPQKED
jgi:hypothetical protein